MEGLGLCSSALATSAAAGSSSTSRDTNTDDRCLANMETPNRPGGVAMTPPVLAQLARIREPQEGPPHVPAQVREAGVQERGKESGRHGAIDVGFRLGNRARE